VKRAPVAVLATLALAPGAASCHHAAADRARRGRRVPRPPQQAINDFGSLVYVRPMAEMNNDNALYNPVQGAGSTPESYRRCSPGSSSSATAALSRRQGGSARQLEGEAQGDLEPRRRRGRLGFYPGKKYVDLAGNDMYGEGADFSRAANEQLCSRVPRRSGTPSPSGALSVDQPSSWVTSATSSRRSRPSSSPPTSTASRARSGTSAEAERLGRGDRLEA
jgi:hypothetical protein